MNLKSGQKSTTGETVHHWTAAAAYDSSLAAELAERELVSYGIPVSLEAITVEPETADVSGAEMFVVSVPEDTYGESRRILGIEPDQRGDALMEDIELCAETNAARRSLSWLFIAAGIVSTIVAALIMMTR